MKTAILIHGYNSKEEYLDQSRPTPSNDHWFPWMQRQLQIKSILAQTPDMPGFYEPRYEKWKQMLERFDLNEETILVEHSCGGGFLLRYLSENNVNVGKVVLVAPWINPDGEYEGHVESSFFNFKIDRNIVKKTEFLKVMYSTDDEESILKTIKILRESTEGIEFQEFNNKGHFVLGSMGSVQFPELLNNLQ